MLTLAYIMKVARLLDQTGEPRPGYLHDDKSNLAGQTVPIRDGILARKRSSRSKHARVKTTKIALEYDLDGKTGDLRLARK